MTNGQWVLSRDAEEQMAPCSRGICACNLRFAPGLRRIIWKRNGGLEAQAHYNLAGLGEYSGLGQELLKKGSPKTEVV